MKNKAKFCLREIVLGAGLAVVGLGAVQLSGCNQVNNLQTPYKQIDVYKEDNLDTIINNIQKCGGREIENEICIEHIKRIYSEIPMKNKNIDFSKLNKKYKEFLKLSDKEKMKKAVEISKEAYGGCNVYLSVDKLTPRDCVALRKLEGSLYWP